MTDTVSPKITIIVPVYNVERYLRRCLDSIAAQTFTDWECILINDGSPDASGTICDEYAANDGRFRVIHQENRGVSAARNAGLDAARGEWIAFVDSDDWVDTDYLEKLVMEAERTNADITGCNLTYEFYNFSTVIKNVLPEDSETAIRNLLLGNIAGWLFLKLFRNSLFRDNQLSFVDGLNMCEDLLFVLKAFYWAKSFAYVDKSLYHYNRVRETSLSFSLNKNKVIQLQQVVAEVERCLKEWSEYDRYEKDLFVLKIHIKIWIATCTDTVQTEYLALYNEDRLYKNKKSTFYNRIFMWLCCRHCYIVARLILFIKKSFRRGK